MAISYSPEVRNRALKLFSEGLTPPEVMGLLQEDIAYQTVRRWTRRARVIEAQKAIAIASRLADLSEQFNSELERMQVIAEEASRLNAEMQSLRWGLLAHGIVNDAGSLVIKQDSGESFNRQAS